MILDKFKTNKELFDHLVENKETLIAQKKAETKHADVMAIFVPNTKTEASKQNQTDDSEEVIKRLAIINTTNWFDSHHDVHLDGLWKKSLQENKMIMHIQEHKMAFDKIISDGEDLSVFTREYKWKELGFDYEGKTEALVFDSTIRKERNQFMFEQYLKNYVKNHSVGMRYIKLGLAINDEDYVAEYELWEKYYPIIANKEQVDENGYFWAVREAKVIEGSAVPIGSNTATPTLSNYKQPEKSTATTQPDLSTEIANKITNFNF